MVGVGAVVEFLRLYYARSGRGVFAAARSLALAAGAAAVGGAGAQDLFRPWRARVGGDGCDAALARYSLLYAGSIKGIGLGFRPTYRATEQPGRFQFLAGCASAVSLPAFAAAHALRPAAVVAAVVRPARSAGHG